MESSSLMLLNYQSQIYPQTEQKLQLNRWLKIYRYWYHWQLGTLRSRIKSISLRERWQWWELNRTENPVVKDSTTNTISTEVLVVLYQCQKPTLT